MRPGSGSDSCPTFRAGYTWDDPDLQLELQNLDERAKTIFPRLLRNPFLVALWATFESGIPQIAEDLARTAETRLALRDIRGANFLDGATKYFKEILRTPLDRDDSRLARLGDLRVLRNVIAHANGERRAVPAEKWKTAEKLVSRIPSVGVHDGYLIVSAEYLTQAFHDVDESLRDLIARIRGPAVRRLDVV